MQSDITRDIASSVNARLTAAERVALARSRQIDPEVEDLYWKGIYYFNKTTVPDFHRSRDFFARMLLKDPQNARAWTSVAMSKLHLGAWGDPSRIPFAKLAGKELTNHTTHLSFSGLSPRLNLIPSIPNLAIRKSFAPCT